MGIESEHYYDENGKHKQDNWQKGQNAPSKFFGTYQQKFGDEEIKQGKNKWGNSKITN